MLRRIINEPCALNSYFYIKIPFILIHRNISYYLPWKCKIDMTGTIISCAHGIYGLLLYISWRSKQQFVQIQLRFTRYRLGYEIIIVLLFFQRSKNSTCWYLHFQWLLMTIWATICSLTCPQAGRRVHGAIKDYIIMLPHSVYWMLFTVQSHPTCHNMQYPQLIFPNLTDIMH